jgi:hypothetical protein
MLINLTCTTPSRAAWKMCVMCRAAAGLTFVKDI